MSYSIYDSVWKIMENYDLEYTDVIHSELKCILCKKLMKNAYSNICGCRYCCKCINNFINAGNTCCPGASSDCKENENYLTDKQIDHVINKKIINLNVKCPFGMCDFKGNLLAFVEHEKFHLNQVKSFEHVDNENIYEFVDSSNKVPVNHTPSAPAKSESVLNSVDIDCIPAINALQSTIYKHNNCIINLGNSIDRIINELNTLKTENKKINDFIFKLPSTVEIDSQQLNLKNTEKIRRSMSKKSIKDDRDIQVDKIQLPIFVALRWEISNFTFKRESAKNGKNTCIFTEKFYAYKNGYRFCLCVWPNGVGEAVDKFLSVGVCLVKGKYDKKLSWPMKHKMSMCFVNQFTNNSYLQSEYCYDKSDEIEKQRYMKPYKRNATIGTLRFMNFDILYNDQFSLNNTVILEFSLNYYS